MDEEHIWICSTIHTSQKQERFQAISKIKPVWLGECSDKQFSVKKKKKKKKWKWTAWDPPLTNLENGTARCSLTLKDKK